MTVRIKYSDALADKICSHIIVGKSIKKISRLKGMPSPSSVFEWLNKHEYFADKYTRAKEAQADYFAEEYLDIADGKGDVVRDRLRLEARKWLMGKMKPKKYGDKTILAGDDDAPLTIKVISYKD